MVIKRIGRPRRRIQVRRRQRALRVRRAGRTHESPVLGPEAVEQRAALERRVSRDRGPRRREREAVLRRVHEGAGGGGVGGEEGARAQAAEAVVGR